MTTSWFQAKRKTLQKILAVLLLGFVVLTLWVDCSNYSLSNIGSNNLNSTTAATTSFVGIKVLNADSYINCFESHVDLGGVCNPGDVRQNYVNYSIFYNRAGASWYTGKDANGNPILTHTLMKLAKCENGHFYATVPPPYDPTHLACPNKAMVEYQVQFQIYTSSDGATFAPGPLSPMFPINVQGAGNCQCP